MTDPSTQTSSATTPAQGSAEAPSTPEAKAESEAKPEPEAEPEPEAKAEPEPEPEPPPAVTWADLDATCKEALGHSARDIAIGAICDLLSDGEAITHDEPELIAAMAGALSSADDPNARACAALLLQEAGIAIEPEPELPTTPKVSGMAVTATFLFSDESHRQAWLAALGIFDEPGARADYQVRAKHQDLKYVAAPIRVPDTHETA